MTIEHNTVLWKEMQIIVDRREIKQTRSILSYVSETKVTNRIWELKLSLRRWIFDFSSAVDVKITLKQLWNESIGKDTSAFPQSVLSVYESNVYWTVHHCNS